ncbi:MAG: helix-turn-helix transcriptional regulator [Deltaproteobacteria bacterium]|nr:helix-turn-helix transcriptional regulator [Deltaproteobacteria bacterium]
MRARDDLSQVAFAKKVGISRQYLCDVEKGRRLVSPEQAARFAKAFGHPPRVLVQLALQDAVTASGLKLRVAVEAA